MEFPANLAFRKARRSALREFIQRSPQAAAKLENLFFTVENGIKANESYLSGLADPANFTTLEHREGDLRAAVAREPSLQAEVGESWSRISTALAQLGPTIPATWRCNRRGSPLLALTLDLVRVVNEEARPVRERLKDYRDPDDLAWRKWRVKRYQPVDNLDLEAFLIGKGLEDLDRELAPDDPLRRQLMDGRKAETGAAVAGRERQLEPHCARVDVRAISEALLKLYGGSSLVAELLQDEGPVERPAKFPPAPIIMPHEGPR